MGEHLVDIHEEALGAAQAVFRTATIREIVKEARRWATSRRVSASQNGWTY